jgi:hypothetical protein
LHQIDVQRHVGVAIIGHVDFQHVIDPLQRVERVFDVPGSRAKLEGRDRNRERLHGHSARRLRLRLLDGVAGFGIGSRHLSVRGLPDSCRLTGSPSSRRGDLRVGVGAHAFKLAAEVLRHLFGGLGCGRALSGPLFGALLRCGRPLAGRRDHGFGIGADMFELGAQLLHRLFGGLACGGTLSGPLLGALLRCGRPLAGRHDLGFGIGADLFKLGAQLLHTPFVCFCGGRALGRSLSLSFGSLLLRRAGLCPRRSGRT